MKPLSSPADLSATILRMTGGTGTSTSFSDMEFAIKARDEEIIAWAKVEKEITVPGPNGWPRLALLDRLIDALRGEISQPTTAALEEWIRETVLAFLGQWSGAYGERAVSEAITHVLRERVPLLRSEDVR